MKSMLTHLDHTWKADRMNEKFFDLKKEKQDRMLNAALKIFAQNGYAHASTDDIVKEAGISKGLLFHYFTNKIGLYSFLYDFSARFVELEMTSTVDRSDNDYFSIHIMLKKAETNVMRMYPYMVSFLNSCEKENVIEALNEICDKKNIVPDCVEEIFKHANTMLIKSDLDQSKLTDLVNFTSLAVMDKVLKENPERPEEYFEKMKDYLILLRNACYK